MITYTQFSSALNCMATSDAVGDPFEFNPNPRPDLVLDYYRGATQLEITDDTQMALFGAEGICETVEHSVSSTEYVQNAYLRWYATQSLRGVLPRTAKGLVTFPSMWEVRAPGNTCLRSLGSIKRGELVVNNSTGCGAVMKLLPFVLLSNFGSWERANTFAINCAKLTHQGKEIDEAVSLYMRAADSLASGIAVSYPLTSASKIEYLGEGWTSLSCVQMALWAVHHSISYEELLTNSICHAGDSDSVAAVAGSLWGITHPFTPTGRLAEQDAVDYILKLVKETFYAHA